MALQGPASTTKCKARSAPRAEPPCSRQLTVRSRPAASPALPLVPGLSITRRPRPRTLSRHRPVLLPGLSTTLPFLISSTSSAERSPSSSSGLLRRGRTGEQSRRTPLNLKLRLLAGVSVSQSSTPRCTPPAALRVRTPGSVGRVPVLRHCACAAGWSGAVSPEPSRAPRRCALGSVCVRPPWLSWWWSSPLVSACARRVQLGREPQRRDRDLRSVHFLCQPAAVNTERSRLTSTDHVCQTGGASGEEPACQCRRLKRHRFDPWVGKIPWRRA